MTLRKPKSYQIITLHNHTPRYILENLNKINTQFIFLERFIIIINVYFEIEILVFPTNK